MQQNRKGKNLLMISCVKRQLTLWMKCLGNKILNRTSLYGCIIGSQLLAPWQAYSVMDCNGFLQKSSQFTKFSTINNWSTCWYCLPLSKWCINTKVISFLYITWFPFFGFVMPGCIVLKYWSHRALSVTHLSLPCTRKFLTCPRNMPLNEVMYYDNVQEIKKVCTMYTAQTSNLSYISYWLVRLNHRRSMLLLVLYCATRFSTF